MSDAPVVSGVGLVGLGKMGTPMSARLVDAGFRVRGFDLDPAARARAAAAGVVAVDDIREVLRGSDVVVLMLPNSRIVASVLEDEEFLGALEPGVVIVDMSSSEPLRTQQLAAELERRGIAFADAPVSGGISGAAAGKLTIMVGGSNETAARLQPVFAPLGRVVHAGPVGAGHAIKALNNLLSAAHLWATSEAMIVGERFGLDPQVMLSIFNSSSGRSGSTENKWPNFILPGSYDSGFALSLMVKDINIATALAGLLSSPITLGDAVVRLWQEAAKELPADADHTEIARWLQGRATD